MLYSDYSRVKDFVTAVAAAVLGFLGWLLWLGSLSWLPRLRRLRRFAMAFPTPVPPLPIIGNITLLFSYDIPGFVQFVIKKTQEYPLGVYWLGCFPVFVASDPRDIEIILKNSEKSLVYELVEELLGKGLITSKGELWRRHHKIILPAFNVKVLETFVPVFDQQADIFIRLLGEHADGGVLDVLPMAYRFSLATICETAMGVAVDAQTDLELELTKNVTTAGDSLFARLSRPWLYPNWAFGLSALKRRQDEAMEVPHRYRERVVADRRRELDELPQDAPCDGKKRRMAFLDHLLLSMRNGAQFSDQELQDEVITFMLAGFDTTALLLTYVIYLLAKHPDEQDKIVAELESIYDPSQETIEVLPEDLGRMQYLEMALKETMRMHTPVPAIARVMEKDVPLASHDLVIPEGAEVVLGLIGTHTQRDNFPEPEKFNPKRFLPENSVDRHPCAYIPFGYGQRTCIGRVFAMMEAKTVMAKVLWHFRILPDPDFQPIITWGATLKPMNGMRVRLQKRCRDDVISVKRI